MRIDVEIFGHRALVSFVPSVLRRMLFGTETRERFADFIGGQWTWSDTGRLLEPDVEDLLRTTKRASVARSTSGVAPPS